MIFIQKLRVQIVTMVRDHCLTFASFLTPIVSRFHLPLRSFFDSFTNFEAERAKDVF
jgi:hypothetical protein